MQVPKARPLPSMSLLEEAYPSKERHRDNKCFRINS